MIVMFILEKYTYEFRQYLDEVGDYVQSCGGDFHIARHTIEFTVPEKYKDFMILKFPFLKEIPLVY